MTMNRSDESYVQVNPSTVMEVSQNHIDSSGKVSKFKLERQGSSTREDEVDHKQGLCNIRAIFFLVLWYLFSACTLFLNKYILSTLKGEPTLLGTPLLISEKRNKHMSLFVIVCIYLYFMWLFRLIS